LTDKDAALILTSKKRKKETRRCGRCPFLMGRSRSGGPKAPLYAGGKHHHRDSSFRYGEKPEL